MNDIHKGDTARFTYVAEVYDMGDSPKFVKWAKSGDMVVAVPADATVEVLERADDPSMDLTGSIRRTKAVTCVARERDGGAGFHRWIAVEINEAFTDDHMRGSHVIGAVPGTPAAEVTVTGEDIDRWAAEDDPDDMIHEAWQKKPVPLSEIFPPRVFRSDGPEPPEDVKALEWLEFDPAHFACRYLLRAPGGWAWTNDPTGSGDRAALAGWSPVAAPASFLEVLPS